ncbi:MAG: ACT domain-containing protein [Thermoclostridium sp.]|nr:ACT domain-containing protein [Thermoclostridium sp.]
MKGMTFLLLRGCYAICRLDSASPVPDWVKGDEFCSITKTSEELSVVCGEEHVPFGVKSETGWRILKIHGELDFALTGILAGISAILAHQGISIFALSTYNTDYVMVKEKDLKQAVTALQKAGHTLSN